MYCLGLPIKVNLIRGPFQTADTSKNKMKGDRRHAATICFHHETSWNRREDSSQPRGSWTFGSQLNFKVFQLKQNICWKCHSGSNVFFFFSFGCKIEIFQFDILHWFSCSLELGSDACLSLKVWCAINIQNWNINETIPDEYATWQSYPVRYSNTCKWSTKTFSLISQKFISEFFFAVDVNVWAGKLNFTLLRK